MSVKLLRPDGSVVLGGGADADFGPITLDQTGAYTLVLDSHGQVGSYAFRLLDVTQPPAIPA